mgnify:FL=1
MTAIVITGSGLLVAGAASAWEGVNAAPGKVLAGASTGLDQPSGIAADSAGLLYVANQDADSVSVYAANWTGGNTAPLKVLSGASAGLN